MAVFGVAASTAERLKLEARRARTFDHGVIAVAAMSVMDDPRIRGAGGTVQKLAPNDVINILYGRVFGVTLFAAWGYVLRDVMDDDDFDALTTRWRSVIGEPVPGG
jgi:hypothetical protein